VTHSQRTSHHAAIGTIDFIAPGRVAPTPPAGRHHQRQAADLHSRIGWSQEPQVSWGRECLQCEAERDTDSGWQSRSPIRRSMNRLREAGANRARTASRDSIVTQYRTRFAGTTLRRIANMQVTAFLVTWCDALNALCSFPPTGRLTVTQGFCPWEACLWACITEGSHSMRSGGHVGSDQGAVPASRQVRFPIDDVADVPPRVHIECRVDRPGCAGCGVTVHVNDRPVVVLVDSPCLARPTHPVWHSGLPSGSRDSGTTGFGHCSAPEIPTGTCSPHS